MISYISIVLLGIGMFYSHSQYKSKGVVWGRPLAGLCGITACVIAIWNITSTIHTPKREREAILRKHQQYMYAGMEFLGDYIAINYPGSTILLIMHKTSTRTKAHDENMVTHLRKGLKEKATIFHQEFVETSNEKTDDAFVASLFDRVVNNHPECNFILSLVGLPVDFKDMRFWSLNPERHPKLIIAFSDVFELKEAIETGHLSAALTYNRNYQDLFNEAIPNDFKEAFHKRFILINQENFKRLSKGQQGLFLPE